MTEPTDDAHAPPRVKSADRTLAVLEYLAAAPRRCSLSDLHSELDIPKSSLHGLLRTLTLRGWVEPDETGTRFGLGVRALLVGTAYIDRDDAVAMTRDTMDWLASESGETVHLARLDGAEVVYLATREAAHDLRLFSRVGRRLPAHATSLGKALLAQQDPGTVRDLLPAELPRLAENTITDCDLLLADLERTRARGYAIDDSENTDGIRCVGMVLPVTSPARDALSLSVPEVRFDEDRESELVRLLAQAVERVVGGRATMPVRG